MAQTSPSQLCGVISVEASAGSGKTYQLALRFIHLVLNNCASPEENLRSILALTFTNKATKEMKERIIDFLKIAASGNYASQRQREDFLGPTGLSAKEAAARAKSAINYLMRHYNNFQVQTINSFMKRLISGFAFRLNMSAAFEIQSDYARYLRFCLERAMDNAQTNREDAALFDEFMQQYLYLEEHSGWFPKNAILKTFKELFGVASSYGMPFVAQDTTPTGAMLKMRFAMHDDLLKLKGILPEKTDRRFVTALNKYCGENTIFSTDDLESWLIKEEFPVNKGGEIPHALGAHWDAIRRQAQIICLHEAHTSFNTCIALYDRIEADLHDVVRKGDMLLLAEIDRHTSALFGPNAVALPEIYYRLASRFRHYLLDEFQDTNILQWNNLCPLVDEALAYSGSLFFVGDKKQAIYRFRGGTTALFDDVPRQFGKRCVPEHKTLATNWRSEQAIVQFNNSVFEPGALRSFIGAIPQIKDSAIPLEPAIVEEVVAPFAHSQQIASEHHNRGRVCVFHPDGEGKEEYDEALRPLLVEKLLALHKRFAWREIAILTRKNDQSAIVGEWLLEAGIAASSERMLDIRANRLVKETLSLLAFLRSPIDDLAFASFITGRIFEAATKKPSLFFDEFVFNARRKEANHSLYTTFRKQYPEIWEEHLQGLFFSAGHVPLYELSASIFGRFALTSNYPGETQYLMQLLECIKYYEDNQRSLPESFFTFINGEEAEKVHISAGCHDAVTLLTIHKSKGLQFPVVILPYLSFEIALAHEGSAAMDIVSGGNALSLIRLKKIYAHHDETLRSALAAKQAKVYGDELNTLYVALTRARFELYAYIPPKNCLRALIASQESGEECRYEARPDNSPEPIVYTPTQYRDWLHLLEHEFAQNCSPAERRARLRGTVLHDALSRLKNLRGQGGAGVLRNAAAAACAKFPGIIAGDELIGELNRIVLSARLKHIFASPDADIFCEKEFANPKGEIFRVDRLLISKDTATIIDFKSTKQANSGYIEQVRQYMKLASALYSGKTVKGFLVYLDSCEIEEAPA